MIFKNGASNQVDVRIPLAKLITQVGAIKDDTEKAADSYDSARVTAQAAQPEFATIQGGNDKPMHKIAYDRPGQDLSLEGEQVDVVLRIADREMKASEASFTVGAQTADDCKASMQELLEQAKKLRPSLAGNPVFLKDFDQGVQQLGTAAYLQHESDQSKGEALGHDTEYHAERAASQDPLEKIKHDTADIDSTPAGQALSFPVYSAALEIDRFGHELYGTAGSLRQEKPYLNEAQKLWAGVLGEI